MMLYGKYSLERHEDALMGWNGNASSARLNDLYDLRVIGNTEVTLGRNWGGYRSSDH
jgi:hypothetical protein